jgi:hypothetical protein
LGAQLVQRTPARDIAELLQPSRQPVALALELLEAEQSRAAEGFLAPQGGGAGRNVGEAARDDLRQLTLQARDLPAQGAPGRRLVERLDGQSRRCAAIDRQLLGLAHVPTPPACAPDAGILPAPQALRVGFRRRLHGSRANAHRACSEARQLHSASSA